MTDKLKNILRGAGSVISVNAAPTLRSAGSRRRVALPTRGDLAEDFQRVAGDLRQGFDSLGFDKISRG